MEKKGLIRQYVEFLKLNNLEVCHESAKEFCDLEEISLYQLSRAYIDKSYKVDMEYSIAYLKSALALNPNCITAKIAILVHDKAPLNEIEEALDKEYDRLLALGYMDPTYYKDDEIDFNHYQETYDYLLSIRNVLMDTDIIKNADDGVRIGNKLIELDPSDGAECRLNLAVYYTLTGDFVHACWLLKTAKKEMPGARELLESYYYLMEDNMEKAVEAFDNLFLVNEFLYRVVSGECHTDFEEYDETLEYESYYFFIFFYLLSDFDDFVNVIDVSMVKHKIEDILTEDERMLIEAMVVASDTNFLESHVVEVCKLDTFHPVLNTYSEGRIHGIFTSLACRGYILVNELTKLGSIYYDYFQKKFYNLMMDLRNKAEEAFQKGLNEEGLDYLNEALRYAPDDLFICKDMVLHLEPFDFKLAASLIHRFYEMYTFFNENSDSLIKHRVMTIDALDQLYYKYYTEAIMKGNQFLIDSYSKVPKFFKKYDYFVAMAKSDLEIEEDYPSDFRKLYEEFKEEHSFNSSLFLKAVTPIELKDIYSESNRIPYGFIDIIFYKNYINALKNTELSTILPQDQMDFLLALKENKVEDDDIDSIVIGRDMEAYLFVVGTKEDTYELADYMKEVVK